MLVGVVIVVFWEKELPYVSGSSFFYLIFGRSLFGILLFFIFWSYGHIFLVIQFLFIQSSGFGLMALSR